MELRCAGPDRHTDKPKLLPKWLFPSRFLFSKMKIMLYIECNTDELQIYTPALSTA